MDKENRGTVVLSGHFDRDGELTKKSIGAFHWSMLMGCHHQGSCDEDAAEAARFFDITDLNNARDELEGYGIDGDCLVEDEDVCLYYLWTLSGNLQENE